MGWNFFDVLSSLRSALRSFLVQCIMRTRTLLSTLRRQGVQQSITVAMMESLA